MKLKAKIIGAAACAFALCVAAIYLSLWAVIIGLWLCVACLILCGPVGSWD